MATPRILIVYGSRHGQTAKIAERLRASLAGRGFAVTLAKGDELPVPHVVEDHDAVIVGASILFGRHQRYIEELMRDHRETLDAVPLAFFSVSGSAGSRREEDREAARRLMRELLARSGWRPAMAVTFAGAIAYTRYGLLTRWLMKRISRRNGGSVDTARDHEYTDWAQVERFAADFAALVEEEVPTAAAPAAEAELAGVGG